MKRTMKIRKFEIPLDHVFAFIKDYDWWPDATSLEYKNHIVLYRKKHDLYSGCILGKRNIKSNAISLGGLRENLIELLED